MGRYINIGHKNRTQCAADINTLDSALWQLLGTVMF